jgi:hypothetical protein
MLLSFLVCNIKLLLNVLWLQYVFAWDNSSHSCENASWDHFEVGFKIAYDKVNLILKLALISRVVGCTKFSIMGVCLLK